MRQLITTAALLGIITLAITAASASDTGETVRTLGILCEVGAKSQPIHIQVTMYTRGVLDAWEAATGRKAACIPTPRGDGGPSLGDIVCRGIPTYAERIASLAQGQGDLGADRSAAPLVLSQLSLAYPCR